MKSKSEKVKIDPFYFTEAKYYILASKWNEEVKTIPIYPLLPYEMPLKPTGFNTASLFGLNVIFW